MAQYPRQSTPMIKIPSWLLPIALACAVLIVVPSSSRGESKDASEKAGAVLFRDKGCPYCHGSALQGTQKGPALTKVRKTMKAPVIVDQIENGGGNMPPFGDSLSHDQIAQLVSFLRAKHRPSVPDAPQ